MKGGKLVPMDTGLGRMCEVAKGNLDASPRILGILYIGNADAPEPLRNLMKEFVDKKITKDEAIAKLDQLAKG